MKSIAVMFTHGPHFNASGREGLDTILAISAICQKIGIFFIADGIFLLLPNQEPAKILAKNFVNLFKILPLYEINCLYLYANSAIQRGFNMQTNLILEVEWLQTDIWNKKLSAYNHVLTF
ncbi:sulfurtransferase complex subunit TusC [Candidatus Palibaumannia cicadellinicola]|uniref:Intracellular reduction protein DsrF n=1 Tax=Baumannia cicadellinicola subsp. Homalodisca coagulata TaxID=374463 RepID=Q1LSY9_BAUCH|nr:sulfurtransferase complex subunit TusC [Candidatus Baumannia cicadellinicola]ABF14154.1 intracellular reduction protein DsrF [Baumannia cicadellinicola str. Hc (Homalodisca coagulata)]MBS0032758.1 sulfurtransferase complex subunit TusC [Candidatus Baumannia cicadellinicola]MCJ7462037.1 sulfurtransferase complex subunit TusC [Candidatus Baumannia cicadellinicola]MCJ7463064.1 sulfurtransferase complex subunit TusC [Candidatus Baumannia cicadellinicola]